MDKGLDLKLHQAGPIPLDLAFTVASNEALALIGTSGAGKTTTLRAIAGLYSAAQGHIRCGGQDWFDSDSGIDVAPHHRRIGIVFQAYALFPHLSAVENVMEAMLDRSASDRRTTALEMLDRVHLIGLADRKPSALSGGQQQRLALARALARDPDILLLDEPFSAVDRPTRRSLRETIIELRASLAIPIILVTHDVEDASHIADTIGLIHEGRLIQIGNTRDVLEYPTDVMAHALLAR